MATGARRSTSAHIIRVLSDMRNVFDVVLSRGVSADVKKRMTHDMTAKNDSIVDTSSHIIYYTSLVIERRRSFACCRGCGLTTSSNAPLRLKEG